ncbi:fused response regulator/phosphatase [Curvivirga aplysinae]|uniref:fused response regulator/phosphatase n=1 Tax=Curvivirga aplysinae TaxID=2529852 RepID=UPI0012BBC8F6|nr:fused response regulator/phosphatase [Curvivirga aplysinae]MTI08851.1 fused response regulator/phosphatase [Curvivirga aplysinae]
MVMTTVKNELSTFDPVPFEELVKLPILIVDDVHLLRQLLLNFLEKEGFENIHIAVDGRDALKKIEEVQPALVILDILMPEMDGFEVCQTLRRNSKYDNIPIIIQTGMEETGERLRIFKEGANDLLLKPVNGAELVARVKVHLQNSLLQGRMREYQERTSKELEAALQIQAALMPDMSKIKRMKEETGLTLGALFSPSSELSGDFWGAEILEDGSLAIYSVDFTGHGVASALNTFRLHSFLSDGNWDWKNPSEWLQKLNKRLCKVLNVGQFATLFYAVIDPDNKTLKYASAGAPPVVYKASKNHDAELLETAGLPIGIMASTDYPTSEFSFEKGAELIIYSDAFIETSSANEDVLGEEDLCRLISEIQSIQSGSEKIDHLMKVFPGRHLERLPDDLTLITVSN